MVSETKTYSLKEQWIHFIHELQNKIGKGLEDEDARPDDPRLNDSVAQAIGRGKAVFISDKWERDGGGGGDTRVIADGNVFEKGGVNTSVVYGDVTDAMRKQLKIEGYQWFACGLSLVMHPVNPYVPTVHANWRYFELYDVDGNVTDRWFGGGADLTPYYIFEEDAKHFHQTIKDGMEPFGTDLYFKYKKDCDEYFSNTHRNNEMRGIGGVFYDHLRPTDEKDAEKLFQFQQANANAFLSAYIPIVNKRKNISYGKREIEWQEIRRGRYVEFNLIHDRGTIFGLKTNGRTESILMSLPPRARWAYNYQPEAGSEEEKLLQVCLHPREWV